MNREEFNGWTNWSTWNVALWIENDGWSVDRDECVRDRTCDSAEKFRKRMTEAFEIPLPSNYAAVTPDGARLEDADWDELYDYLVVQQRAEEEREETSESA